jgi:hypothetical protein
MIAARVAVVAMVAARCGGCCWPAFGVVFDALLLA